MKRAYLVRVPEMTVFVEDERDLGEIAGEIVKGGNFRADRLSVAELRIRGDLIPVGEWDPKRELTCAEIAVEMERGRPDAHLEAAHEERESQE